MVNIEKLQKKLKNNIEYIFSDEKDYLENESTLYLLLLDHPFFIENVKKIRNKFCINDNGFTEPKDAHYWRYENMERKHKYIKQVQDLAMSFQIKQAFRSRVIFFIEDYILCEKLIERLLPRIVDDSEDDSIEKSSEQVITKKVGAKIIKADKDREINKYLFTPEKTYIEISNETTSRDIDEVFKIITERKKERYRYTIVKSGLIAREIWHAAQNGFKHSEICSLINTKYEKNITIENIAVYKKRYKNALERLRPF